ncbi:MULTISPECIES: hypothetical protein [unclassified Moorena]|uniref:hypothetical protein n=1 Tax=unclassified Moorena TaxID=2683338 RepID=UPI0013B7EC63|nr:MULTISPECIES: hypothetical protein [unclassified Moorena]NEP31895.1 hypothetical protein [Moorena sp. SIO3B2]NEQ07352.1 hypothetical protein [Moorena sp. SIO4E2]NEQ12610.1 hypothetical protein [Moorena sp. SIO3E2]NER88828.1 hypothetical protein [Moorena sp. SIO3A2]
MSLRIAISTSNLSLEAKRKHSAISLSATRTLREQPSAISHQLMRYAHASRTAIS